MASTIPLKGESINLWGVSLAHHSLIVFLVILGVQLPLHNSNPPRKVHLNKATPLMYLSPHLINKDLYDIHSTSPTPKSHTTCGCKEVFELHNFLSVKWRIWRQNDDLEHPGGVSFQKWDDLKKSYQHRPKKYGISIIDFPQVKFVSHRFNIYIFLYRYSGQETNINTDTKHN